MTLTEQLVNAVRDCVRHELQNTQSYVLTAELGRIIGQRPTSIAWGAATLYVELPDGVQINIPWSA